MNIKKNGLESTVSSTEFTNVTEDHEGMEVFTELSYHPDWNVPKEQHYVFSFLNNELLPLMPNQISLSGIEWNDTENGVEVTAFVRNSLSKPIEIKEAELLLINQKKQLVARKVFDFTQLGSLPPQSSRPWIFPFSKENIVDLELLEKENWTLAFNMATKQEHQLDLDQAWEESLSLEDKTKLTELVKNLPKLQDREFNLMGLSAKYNNDESLIVTILLRNGNDQNVQLEKIPLEVLDANNEVVARGGFEVNLEIKANTTKPWSFIFPKEMVQMHDADLSKWRVQLISSN